MSRRRRRSRGCTGSIPSATFFVEQSEEAIAAGAFHNDVVAVANEHVLFAHELAFADKARADRSAANSGCPASNLSKWPTADVPLGDAIRSYLFNAQLVTPPDGEMTLIVPTEARETPSVWRWIERHVAGNGPIRRVEVVDVRQSMANGGGPACLRLRVVADPCDRRSALHGRRREARPHRRRRSRSDWPDEIDSDDLQRPALIERHRGGARSAAWTRSI